MAQNPYLPDPVKPPVPGQPGVAPGMPPQAPQRNPYDLFREQATQRNQVQMQEGQNALQRRMAQMGGGPAGAGIKLEQNLMNQGRQELDGQMNQINAQEAQQHQQGQEAALQREFQNRVFDFEKDMKQKQFGQAERQAGLDEQGQFFNQAMAASQSNWDPGRFRDEITRFIDLLDQQQQGNGAVYNVNTREALLRRQRQGV